MSYGWIITTDFTDNDGKSVGVFGPSGICPRTEKKLRDGNGVPFRLYDDDDELYYVGRYIGDFSEDAFGPLDDYGTPNAGCTRIDYYDEEKKIWETL